MHADTRILFLPLLYTGWILYTILKGGFSYKFKMEISYNVYFHMFKISSK